MQELGRLLGGDSSPWDPISTIGTIGVFLVAIGLAVAAVRRARSVISLARNTRPQGESESLEAEPRVAFAVKETFPSILIGAETSREGVIKKDTMAILNMGGGIAKDLHLLCLDETSSYEISLDKRALVVRDILPVPFAGSPGAVSRFQLTFRTDFGTRFSLEFEWDSGVPQAMNERLTVISTGSPAT